MRNLNDGLRRQVGQLHTFCQFSLLPLSTSVSSQSIQPPPSLFHAFPPSTSFPSSSRSNPCPSVWAFSVSCLCRPQTRRVKFRQFVQLGTCDGCTYFEAARANRILAARSSAAGVVSLNASPNYSATATAANSFIPTCSRVTPSDIIQLGTSNGCISFETVHAVGTRATRHSATTTVDFNYLPTV